MNAVQALTTRSVVFTLVMILQTGISFVLIPVYTAYLTPADYGILSIATAIGNLLAILYLQSLEGVFTRFYVDFTDDGRRRRFYGAVWLFHLAFVAALSAMLEVIGHTGVLAEHLPIPYDPYIRYVVWTAFITTTTLLLPRALFIIREETWKYAALNLGLFVASTAAIVWFVVARREGAAGSLKGTLFATAVIAIPALGILARNIRPAWDLANVKGSLKFALPLVPHLLSLWALDLVDRLILRRYVPLEDIGIYTLGYQIGSIPQLVAYAFSTAIAPFYYKTAAAGEQGLPVLANLAAYYVAVVVWVGVVTVAAGGDLIAVMAEHPAYTDAYRVIPWVALGSCIRAFYFVFVTALYYTKSINALPLVSAIAAGLNIALNFIAIPRFGYVAAAVTTATTFAVQAALMCVFARRALPISYDWTRLAGLSVVAIVWVSLIALVPVRDPWLGVVVKGTLALAFPLTLLVSRVFSVSHVRQFFRGTGST